MWQKYIINNLIIILLSTCIINAASLKLLERRGPTGSTILVPAILEEADDFAGGEFLLQFDKTLLDIAGVELTAQTTDFLFVWEVKDNHIAISMAGASGIKSDRVTLFQISFRIKRVAQMGDAMELTWKKASVYGSDLNEIPCEFEHGIVRVSDIIVFPDPFTPNNDGYNDFANFVVPDSIADKVTVKIFNISGRKIRVLKKESASYIVWDGISDEGKISPPGIYLFLLESDTKQLKKGTITLMR